MSEKIIIDTDIGDNVDDALALALACRSPELELLAVTTVWHNVADRVRLARKLLRALGRPDAPVGAGLGCPTGGAEDPERWLNQAVVLTEAERAADVRDAPDAQRLLAETIERHPGEVTLVPIGPLSNVARLVRNAPATARKLKRIVMMGGAYLTPHKAETNIRSDPEAAQTVLESGIPLIAIGLDVTLKCQTTPEHIERIARASDPGSQLLSRLIAAWSAESRRHPILHDPLAVAMCFQPDLCELREMLVGVQLPQGLTIGASPAKHQPANARVCVEVAAAR
ncbi:MAG: nucleoside hydrolase, partial [Verrucomicrobiae bacterium]|nr:nucleoside hydrolase [Verrucomicrobiae bacterium]